MAKGKDDEDQCDICEGLHSTGYHEHRLAVSSEGIERWVDQWMSKRDLPAMAKGKGKGKGGKKGC